MKCSLGVSNFLEEISILSHPIVFLFFFALIPEEGFLSSPCYSLELCIQMGIAFLFSFAEEPGGLHGIRVGHDWAHKHPFYCFSHAQCVAFCINPQNSGWALLMPQAVDEVIATSQKACSSRETACKLVGDDTQPLCLHTTKCPVSLLTEYQNQSMSDFKINRKNDSRFSLLCDTLNHWTLKLPDCWSVLISAEITGWFLKIT